MSAGSLRWKLNRAFASCRTSWCWSFVCFLSIYALLIFLYIYLACEALTSPSLFRRLFLEVWLKSNNVGGTCEYFMFHYTTFSLISTAVIIGLQCHNQTSISYQLNMNEVVEISVTRSTRTIYLDIIQLVSPWACTLSFEIAQTFEELQEYPNILILKAYRTFSNYRCSFPFKE
jgi:hypothetical protein